MSETDTASHAITSTDKFSREKDEIIIASNRNIEFTRWYTELMAGCQEGTHLSEVALNFIFNCRVNYCNLSSLLGEKVELMVVSRFKIVS